MHTIKVEVMGAMGEHSAKVCGRKGIDRISAKKEGKNVSTGINVLSSAVAITWEAVTRNRC